MEALAAQRRLAVLLRSKLKRVHSEICGFVLARMSLTIVRSNSLLIHVPQENEAKIRQQLKLTDVAVIVLLVPWSG